MGSGSSKRHKEQSESKNPRPTPPKPDSGEVNSEKQIPPKSASPGQHRTNSANDSKDAAHAKEQPREPNVTLTPGTRPQSQNHNASQTVASTNTQNPGKQPPLAKPTAKEQKMWRECCTLKINAWAAVVNTLSCLAAVVALWFVYGQLVTMDRQLKQMQADSNSAAIVTDRQLKIMEGQLSEMRATAQLEQRAWVGLLHASHKAIEQGKGIEVTFRITNTGKTPAIVVTSGRTICIRPPNFDIETFATSETEQAWMKETRSQGPLPPNGILTMDISTKEVKGLEMPESMIADIKSGELSVYVVGRIVYKDIFGGEHQTRFCYTANPSTEGMIEYHQYNYMN
jgi:hypothetical protein